MNKTVKRSQVRGTITAPTSKSYAQRAIAAALLAGGRTTLTNMELCDDISAALSVARALGAVVSSQENTYTIDGGFNPRGNELQVGESGLATRLFTPIASLHDKPIVIRGTGTLLSRPLEMMEETLRELGVTVKSNNGYLPFEVCGPIHGGDVAVDGSLSSQFLTGLLMTLPLARTESVLRVGCLNSKPYIDMTLAMLDSFGIHVVNYGYREFRIPARQRYVPGTHNIEGDWSGASCMLVAGAVAGEVEVENLSPRSLQADGSIVSALESAGADIVFTNSSCSVRSTGRLKAFEFDATHCPDTFPALVALAANCEGTSVITGTARLKNKESHRALTLAAEFMKMGIDVDLSDNDRMKVTGGKIRSATVNSHNDHRIAMAAAVAGLASDGAVTVEGAEAVNKSYPKFWSDLEGIAQG